MVQKYVLLVEDDSFIADLYLLKLKISNFEADVAASGEKAIEKIARRKPDLLLLDIVLPGIDGWQLLKRIREDKNLKGIKVIVLSNLEKGEELKKALNLGVVKYLIKAHYTPSGVIKEIKKVFSSK